MQQQANIIDCYEKTAAAYAQKFGDELNEKHFDRILLKSFAAENIDKGISVDLGCGPGQATKYLSDHGLKDIIGVDLSPSMIAIAKKTYPSLNFETGDMLGLHYANESFDSAVALYSIVHFDYEQIEIAFKEIRRVLKDNGSFLFSFHIGDKVLHLDDFLEHSVDIEFYFFDIEKIVALLSSAGFDIIDIIERNPYPGVEYPSQRAYIWAKKPALPLK